MMEIPRNSMLSLDLLPEPIHDPEERLVVELTPATPDSVLEAPSYVFHKAEHNEVLPAVGSVAPAEPEVGRTKEDAARSAGRALAAVTLVRLFGSRRAAIDFKRGQAALHEYRRKVAATQTDSEAIA
jgi:hypothetical protein